MQSPLPITQADAVVIGAGAFGLSAAYQLAAHGAGRVVVLDRFAPGSQTSPRAAGLYKLIQADEARTRLAQSSIEVIRGFSEATGIPLPFVQSGSVLAARTTPRLRLLEAAPIAAMILLTIGLAAFAQQVNGYLTSAARSLHEPDAYVRAVLSYATSREKPEDDPQ